MLRRQLAALPLLALIGLGCGGAEGAASADASPARGQEDGGLPPGATAEYVAFQQAMCAAQERCCAVHLMLAEPPHLRCDVELRPAPTFNAAAAEACKAQLVRLPCSLDLGDQGKTACGQVYDWPGTKPLGAPCRDLKECAPSAQGVVRCTAPGTMPTTCQVLAPGKDGDGPCTPEGDAELVDGQFPEVLYRCDAGDQLVCDERTHRCRRPILGGAGEPCPCRAELFCSDLGCRPRMPAGTPCSPDGYAQDPRFCAEGTYCNVGTRVCTVPQPLGGQCSATTRCEAGMCEGGVCVPRTPVPPPTAGPECMSR